MRKIDVHYIYLKRLSLPEILWVTGDVSLGQIGGCSDISTIFVPESLEFAIVYESVSYTTKYKYHKRLEGSMYH